VSIRRWRRYSYVDVLAIGIAFAMVAFRPSFGYAAQAPKVAVVLAIAPLGVVLLWRDVRQGDRMAMALAALGVWFTATALTSDSPALAVFGVRLAQPSLVNWIGAICAWAIGRRVTRDGQTAVGWSVVAAVLISTLVAVAETFDVITSAQFSLFEGRPPGLASNPVYFGAFAAAAGAWFGYHVLSERYSRTPLSLGFGFATFAVTLSGSRVALLAIVLIAIAVIVRGGVRRGWVLVPAAMVGAVLATLLHRLVESTGSALDRGATSGMEDRLTVWRYALRAWLDRPLQGWGTGRLMVAGQQYYPDSWIERFPEGNWADAHNIGVETLVTQGLIGLILLIVVGVLAAKRARGPLVWMALAIALGWTLEPTSVMTLGLFGLLFGASMCKPATDQASNTDPRERTRWLALLVVGSAVGAWYYVGDMTVLEREASADAPPLGWMWWWQEQDPRLAEEIGNQFIPVPGFEHGDPALALAWAKRSVELEPELSRWSAGVALRYLRQDDLNDARAWAEKAVELQPNNSSALVILTSVAKRQGDDQALQAARTRLCAIGDASACNALDAVKGSSES
jgi:O-antigen ligase